MSYAIITGSVLIQKKSGSEVNFTAEITNFKEKGIDKKVNYTPLVGGRVLPRLENQDSTEISFDFELTGNNMETLVGTNDFDWDYSTYDNNLHKIELTFLDDGVYYTKRYYDCFITQFKVNPSNDVLQGEIVFSLPLKNLDGNTTIYNGSNITSANTYDTTMGY